MPAGRWARLALLAAVLCSVGVLAHAQTPCTSSPCSVGSASDLVAAITYIDNNPSTAVTINFTASVTLTRSR